MFGGVENAVGGMFGSPKKEPFGKASAMAMEDVKLSWEQF